MQINNLSIHIDRDDIGFSAAHFTIFSKNKRESLHGHNFSVGVEIVATGEENGMIFDYRFLKARLRELCKILDEKLLLPANSRYLSITRSVANIECRFGEDLFSFPIDDVVILDVQNITIEGLSEWFLWKLIETPGLPRMSLAEVCISVSSSRGQIATRRISLK